jgi:hypothetical protein
MVSILLVAEANTKESLLASIVMRESTSGEDRNGITVDQLVGVVSSAVNNIRLLAKSHVEKSRPSDFFEINPDHFIRMVNGFPSPRTMSGFSMYIDYFDARGTMAKTTMCATQICAVGNISVGAKAENKFTRISSFGGTRGPKETGVYAFFYPKGYHLTDKCGVKYWDKENGSTPVLIKITKGCN